MAAAKKSELLKELSSIVGDNYVSDDYSVLLLYTRDMSIFSPAQPQGAVVRPGSVEEVVQLVRLANQTRTPLIPMGGKATVCGVPPGQPGRGIIVDMRRLDKILEIDKTHLAVTCQCGITLGELAGKVNEQGYDVHTAGTPHFVDTVGGHLSGTPGAGFGSYGFSIGYNWHYILGMKVVLPDANVVDTGTGEGSLSTYRGHTWARGMHGPDFTGMFIGDGGIFGIKVEATYRMFHFPKFKKGSARCYDTLEQAFAAYNELWEVDPFMYMQSYANSVILGPETTAAIAPGAAQVWVLPFGAVGNTEEEVDFKLRSTDAICAKHGGKEPDEAVAKFAQDFIGAFVHEVSQMATLGQLPLFELILSRRDILDAFKFTRAFVKDGLKERGYDTAAVSLISVLLSAGTGYGMTSVIPAFDANDKKLAKTLQEMMVEWLEQCMRRGYVPEATHGHESRLKARQWTGEFYHYARNMKKFLDPNNIMNPGVFFP